MVKKIDPRFPFPAVNNHTYNEYETENTWQFHLYNMRGRLLVSHSCAKSCYEAGRKHFWDKVAVLYSQIEAAKTAKRQVAAMTHDRRKESKSVMIDSLEALLAESSAVLEDLDLYLATQSQIDFLDKIEPVSMPV